MTIALQVRNAHPSSAMVGEDNAIEPACDPCVETLLAAQRLRDARRGRVDSNDSENSGGSGKNGDTSNFLQTPGANLAPGSAPVSRGSSFRENSASRVLSPPNASTSRRSPTPRPQARTGKKGRDLSSSNLSNTSSSSQNNSNNSNTDRHRYSGNDDANHFPSPQHLSRRRSSMPNVAENYLAVPEGGRGSKDRDAKLRRVRSFKTTSKGAVVNRGDSFKKKSTHTLASAGNAITEASRQRQLQQQHYINNELYTPDLPPTPTYYRVFMMGAAGCGKSQMTKQFMTSEFVDSYDDTSESHENAVSVLLDGEESTIEFIDPPDRNVIQEGLQQLLDAYIVVFAINDHSSFEVAQDLIRFLRVEHGTDRVIVLVANKIDLVRKRKVSADEARLVAETYDCKYTETSSALNHFMDELLVGVLTQIRLHMRIPFTTISFPGKDQQKQERKERKRALRGPGRGFFSRLFRRTGRKKTKPCENLYAL